MTSSLAAVTRRFKGDYYIHHQGYERLFNVIEIDRRFRGGHCLHTQGVPDTSETSLYIDKITGRCIPEVYYLHKVCC